MLRFLSLVLALVVFFVGLLFALRNAAPVSVDYVWGTFHAPLSYVAFGGCVIGLLLGFAGCALTILRLRRTNRKLRRDARSAAAEVSSLRKAPLQDAH